MICPDCGMTIEVPWYIVENITCPNCDHSNIDKDDLEAEE